MNNSECPPDSQLLAIEAGDETNAQLQSHVDGCDWCQQRTAQLQKQLDQIAEACNELDSHQTEMQLPTKNPGSTHGPSHTKEG